IPVAVVGIRPRAALRRRCAQRHAKCCKARRLPSDLLEPPPKATKSSGHHSGQLDERITDSRGTVRRLALRRTGGARRPPGDKRRTRGNDVEERLPIYGGRIADGSRPV